MVIKPRLGAKLNRSHPLTRGMVGCWLLNEGGGSSFFNLAKGPIANLGSGHAWFNSSPGSAIACGGATDIDTGLDADAKFGATGPFTLISLVRTTSTVSSLIVAGKFNGAGDDYWMGVNSGSATISTSGFINSEPAPAVLNDGKWHWMIGSADATSTYIYVDSVLRGTNTRSGADAGGTLRIGKFGVSAGFNWPDDVAFLAVVKGVCWTPSMVAQFVADPYAIITRPRRRLMVAPATTFNPAWARNSNVMIGTPQQ